MKTRLLVVIIYACAAECANITKAAAADGNQTQHVQNLEKQKTEIYNQLNEAVVDTIKTLEKSNDSDAKQGIKYMRELILLVDSFNGTELAPARACNDTKECATHDTASTQTNNSSKVFEDAKGGTRRRHKTSGFDHIKHAIIQSGTFQGQDELDRKRDEKVKNILILQAKLDKWLKLRELEKKKIRLYKSRQATHRHVAVTEECPDFGESNKKKGKKSDGSKKATKYPCCRKCCKKSYLGCL